jgi:hypothetical protein
MGNGNSYGSINDENIFNGTVRRVKVMVGGDSHKYLKFPLHL